MIDFEIHVEFIFKNTDFIFICLAENIKKLQKNNKLLYFLAKIISPLINLYVDTVRGIEICVWGQ